MLLYQNESLKWINADSTWGGGKYLEENDLRKSFDPLKRQQEKEEMMEKLKKLRNESITQWHGSFFHKEVFDEIYREQKETCLSWVDAAIQTGLAARQIVGLTGGFYANLCRTFLEFEPEKGKLLWEQLYQKSPKTCFLESYSHVDWMLLMLFEADGEIVKDMRIEYLKESNNDCSYLDIAFSAFYYERNDWLREEIVILLESPVLLNNAQGLTLLCVSNFTENEFLEILEKYNFEDTWVEEKKDELEMYYYQNIWACHWFKKFLNEESDDVSWGAFQLFLKCVDKRYWLWNKSLLDDYEKSNKKRWLFLIEMENNIQESIEKNQKGMKETLFARKICKGQVYPFMH